MTLSEHTDTEDLLRDALAAEAVTAATPAAPSLDRLRELAARPAPPTPRPRTRRRLLAAAAAIAVVAAGGSIVAVQQHGASQPPAVVAGRGLSADASTALLQIAAVADATPLDAPRPDQFNYSRTLTGGGLETSEIWAPQTPGDNGLIRNVARGRTDQMGYDTRGLGFDPTTDLGTYAGLSRVPTDDPDALLAAIDAQDSRKQPSDTTTSYTLKLIIEKGLLTQVLPPTFAGALYRALAGLPDITLTRNVADLAGRTGIAIGATDKVGERFELILDPHTFAPLGTREYPVAAGPRSPEVGRSDGPTDTYENAILAVDTVDHAGELPPGR